MTFINNKRSKQFFYPLNSNYGRKFSQSPSHQVLLKVSHRQIPNFSRPSTRFPKQFKDIFSFMKLKTFQRLFKAGLEFKAGAGTLDISRVKGGHGPMVNTLVCPHNATCSAVLAACNSLGLSPTTDIVLSDGRLHNQWMK